MASDINVLILDRPLTTGLRLRVLRTVRGWSQWQVAYAARCSPNFVSQLERDCYVSAGVRRRILAVLGLDEQEDGDGK